MAPSSSQPWAKANVGPKASAPTATPAAATAVQPVAKKPRQPAVKPVLPSGTERHTTDAAEVIQQIVPWVAHFAHDV